MASACVNNNVGAAETTHRFFNSPSNSSSSSFDWFNPRLSNSSTIKPSSSPAKHSSENLIDLEFNDEDTGDFEFRLEDPTVNMMLPADELFFDGKLMPLHVSTGRVSSSSSEEIRSVSVTEIHQRLKISSISSGLDPYLFSPKAPRCSSGWRELLGLKRLQNSSKQENLPKSPTKSSSSSLKNFMVRNSKSDLSSSSLALPLLKEKEKEKETETEIIRDNSDLPRISLDSHKCPNPKRNNHNHHHQPQPPNIRLVRKNPETSSSSGNVRLIRRNQDITNTNSHSQTTQTSSGNALGVSMDSPRMNSSGKVVFQSLERSSSSPSTFNGGPRVKYKGMERRSYSANVKVSPVLNVPVCSLRGSSKFGLGQLFPSPHKRAGAVGSASSSSSTMESSSSSERNRNHHTNKQKSIS